MSDASLERHYGLRPGQRRVNCLTLDYSAGADQRLGVDKAECYFSGLFGAQ